MRGFAVRPACIMPRKLKALNAGRSKVFISLPSSPLSCRETACAGLFIESQSTVPKLRIM